MNNRNQKGYIHSYESGGTVDGPGLRFVVFLQGCLMRCLYCHNPDTWDYRQGKLITAGEVLDEALKYRNFMEISGGGVTLSGGEPLHQVRFTRALLKGFRRAGIHTVVDTSGFASPKNIVEIIQLTDLFLLDIKCMNNTTHRKLTGQANNRSLHFAGVLSAMKKPMILRYVLVPGLNDSAQQLRELSEFARTLDTVQHIELLPFHKMGEYKWKDHGIPYQLHNTPEPTDAQIERATDIMTSYGLEVH